MKLNKIVFGISLVSGLLFSCNPNANVTPDPKLGDTWVMRYEDYDEYGSLISAQDINVTTSEVIFNEESWVQLNSPLGSLGIFKMKSDGLHHLSSGVTDELFFTFPGNVGDSTFFHLNGENYYHKTDAVNTSAILIGGTFNGVNSYTQYDDNSYEATILFTENEWFIKFMEFDEKVINPPGMFMDYQYEIISYTPN